MQKPGTCRHLQATLRIQYILNCCISTKHTHTKKKGLEGMKQCGGCEEFCWKAKQSSFPIQGWQQKYRKSLHTLFQMYSHWHCCLEWSNGMLWTAWVTSTDTAWFKIAHIWACTARVIRPTETFFLCLAGHHSSCSWNCLWTPRKAPQGHRTKAEITSFCTCSIENLWRAAF